MQLLTDQGVQVTHDPELADLPVTGTWNNEKASAVLTDIGAQCPKAAAFRRGQRWHIGIPTPADTEARVIRSPWRNPSPWLDLISKGSRPGLTTAAADDTILIRDTPENLEIAQRLYSELAKPRDAWCIDVEFIEANEQAARALGIDWNVAASIAATAAIAIPSGGASVPLSAELLANPTGAVRATANNAKTRTVTTTRLIVQESKTATMQIGQTIPIAKRTTTPQGGVETTGYEQVQAGILLSISATKAGPELVNLDVAPEISSVAGFVQGAPILSRRRIECATTVRPGETVILGGFESRTQGLSNDNGVPGLENIPGGATTSSRKEKTRLYIILRIAKAN